MHTSNYQLPNATSCTYISVILGILGPRSLQTGTAKLPVPTASPVPSTLLPGTALWWVGDGNTATLLSPSAFKILLLISDFD